MSVPCQGTWGLDVLLKVLSTEFVGQREVDGSVFIASVVLRWVARHHVFV